MHLGDLARGCSDLVMTWLLCGADAATGRQTWKHKPNSTDCCCGGG